MTRRKNRVVPIQQGDGIFSSIGKAALTPVNYIGKKLLGSILPKQVRKAVGLGKKAKRKGYPSGTPPVDSNNRFNVQRRAADGVYY